MRTLSTHAHLGASDEIWSKLAAMHLRHAGDCHVDLPGLPVDALVVQLSGVQRAETWVDGIRSQPVHVTAGEAIFCPAGHPLILDGRADSDVVHLFMEPALYTEVAASIGARSIIDPLQIARSTELVRLGLQALGELSSAPDAASVDDERFGLDLSATMISAFEMVARPKREQYVSISPTKLRQVIEYLHSDLRRKTSLADLAALAGMSKFHFLRCFRAEIGATPHQYLIRLRVEAAIRRLERHRTSLADLATDLGFASQSHFVTMFKAQVGVTPGAYRALLK